METWYERWNIKIVSNGSFGIKSTERSEPTTIELAGSLVQVICGSKIQFGDLTAEIIYKELKKVGAVFVCGLESPVLLVQDRGL
jgi:hypothetical protein